MAAWHTIATARAEWDDAPTDDAILSRLLEASKEAVLSYAPPTDTPEDVPGRYVIAQLRHARNVYRSEYSDRDGLAGLDGPESFALPARFRDLDASIRELIRPRRALGPVG